MLWKDRSFKKRSLDCQIVFGNIPRRPIDELPSSLNENFCGAPETLGELLTAWFMPAPRSRTNGAKFCFMFPGI